MTTSGRKLTIVRVAVAVLLGVFATNSGASDCLYFSVYELKRTGEIAIDGTAPHFVKELPISRADIFKLQVITTVGEPDPQSLGEIFESFQGELEVDPNAEQYSVSFVLSPQAASHMRKVAKALPYPILRIRLGDTVVNEARLLVRDGDWVQLQFRVSSYGDALTTAKLLAGSCDYRFADAGP
jgi:hypothetical protein